MEHNNLQGEGIKTPEVFLDMAELAAAYFFNKKEREEVILPAMKMYAAQFKPAPLPDKDFEEFLIKTKNEFVGTILKYFPHEFPLAHQNEYSKQMRSDIRVASENIIIAFDQLRERLQPQPIPSDVAAFRDREAEKWANADLQFQNITREDSRRTTAIHFFDLCYSTFVRPKEILQDIEALEEKAKEHLESCRELYSVIKQWRKDFKSKDVEISTLQSSLTESRDQIQSLQRELVVANEENKRLNNEMEYWKEEYRIASGREIEGL